MAYTLEDVLSGRVLVCCTAKEQARRLLNFFSSAGLDWRSGDSLDNIKWDDMFDKMCYGVEKHNDELCVVNNPKVLIEAFPNEFTCVDFKDISDFAVLSEGTSYLMDFKKKFPEATLESLLEHCCLKACYPNITCPKPLGLSCLDCWSRSIPTEASECTRKHEKV